MKRFLLALFLTVAAIMAPCMYVASHVGVLEVVSFDSDIDENSPGWMHDRVDGINANSTIKAVLLEMNSPGGGVYASGELRDEIARIKVPVVAYCRFWCASGGYYAITASSVKDIVVGRGTLIGSVGVIRGVRRQDVPTDVEIYKSGKFKQAGNVNPPVDGEKEYLQRSVDEMAQTFYDAVKTARGSKISDEAWVRIKNAEVFDGPKGVELGLADHVASRDEAIRLAKSEGGFGEARTFTREELVKHPLDVFLSLFR